MNGLVLALACLPLATQAPVASRAEPERLRLESASMRLEPERMRLEPELVRLEPQHAQLEPQRVQLAPELARLELALERAGAWLAAREREDGAFAPAARAEVCLVAATALALWSLEEPDPVLLELDASRRAADFLSRRRQPDGGLYDPSRGLAVYTSGVASRALRVHAARTGDADARRLANDVELYARGRRSPESAVDGELAARATAGPEAARAARALLDARRGELDAAERRALDFLSRCEAKDGRAPARLRPPGALVAADGFTYEDLLPYVYLEVAPEEQVAQRALSSLRASFTVERNPDLTRRYGAAGFPGNQGLYYYFLIAAKTLDVHGLAILEVEGSGRREAARELAARLERLQLDDGSWRNPDGRWWEDEPVLTTSYAVLALKHCRRLLVPRPR
ncbi:MAG: hypothetical protein HZA52_15205 [Planctomycetes bacterium]|nr:hypothetical protein [Planctomycetota bacterium]